MHQLSPFPLADPLSATGQASPDAAADFLVRSPEQRLQAALDSLRAGEGVLVLDDEDRENEADIIYAAESCTEAQMARLIRDGSGIVCLCLTAEACARLDLPPMCARNTNRQQTAFTVSIEAAEGVTTGVSAADRLRTVQAAIHPQARPADLRRPGHVFPLRARPGGVLERRGHTEAVIDLMLLAGLRPCGLLCELTLPDGRMARRDEAAAYARRHGLPLCTVEDIARHRARHDAQRQAAER